MTAIRTVLCTVFFTAVALTQVQAAEIIGGDVFEAGANATITGAPTRDAFATGFSATLDGTIAGDGHAAGFDVDVDGSIGADLYAVGASVSVTAPVGEDLTASGFSVRLRANGSVEGNARLMGGSVRVDGPVQGSLMATGGTITLNAPVAGDVRMTAGDINFGGNARIGGTLVYAAPDEIDIPESVVAADRVRYVQIASFEGFDGLREMMNEPQRLFWPSFFAIVTAFVVTLAFLVVVAAVFVAFLPKRVDDAFSLANGKPGLSLLSGFLAMALLFGLVPVSAMTLIGAPFVPIVILFIILSWVAAYLLGAYTASMRLAGAFGAHAQTNIAKLAVLAVGLLVLAFLNFVPFLGWLINIVIVLLGLGAIALMVVGRIDGPALVALPPREDALPAEEAKARGDDGEKSSDAG